MARIGEMTDRIVIQSNTPVAVAVSGITRSGSTATVTTAEAHGFVTGDYVTHAGAAQAEYNGEFQVTVTNTTVYTVTVAGTPVSPATGTITTLFTSDAQGGTTQSWWTLATVWAQVKALSATERVSLGGIAATADYIGKIYYRQDVKPTMRVSWTPYLGSARTLEIHGVEPDRTDPRRLLRLSLGEVVQ
jgi:SPP1 family predicted phage head-tail adaptor